MHGMILRAQSDRFWVLADGGVFECTLRGRLKQQQSDSDIAVIGDHVSITALGERHGVIDQLFPRATRLSRRRPSGHDGFRPGHDKEDVIVANVDLLLIVFACAQPTPNPRVIDRFLLVAEHNQIEPALVANKADLAAEPERRAVFDRYARLGYPVYATSAHDRASVAPLRALLTGRTSALVGPSGVGKSSLLNAIQPGLRLRTGAVSDALNKGRHTTVAAELLALEGGGYVADTPGLRELGLWQVPPEALAEGFRELRPLLGACAFSGCSHIHEPGCAVRQAVEQGEVSEARYDSYARLYAEAEPAQSNRRAVSRPAQPKQPRRRHASWDDEEEAGFEAIRRQRGAKPAEVAQRARSREFGKMAKQIMEEKRRSRGS